MQFEKLKEIQDFFLEVSLHDPSIDIKKLLENKISCYFDQKTIHRLEAYRNCYFARISSVFPETTFYLASCLFGKKFVAGFLIEYFLCNPSPADMFQSVRNFSHFLENHENIIECPFVPDFIKFCLLREDILGAENPIDELFIYKCQEVPSASHIFLQKHHKLLNSQWPLYQMHTVARYIDDLKESDLEKCNVEENTDIEKERVKRFSEIDNQPECVLLYKSSQCVLEVILIPEEYIPLVELMGEGNSLEQAIDNYNIDDSFDTQKFSTWIALLTQHKALVKGI